MKSVNPVKKLQLINKEIDVNNSKVLFDQPLTTDNIPSLFEIHNSEWTVENGWLCPI